MYEIYCRFLTYVLFDFNINGQWDGEEKTLLNAFLIPFRASENYF